MTVFVAGDLLDYSSVLLGMLVMQDVQLGLFIAVMPTLIQAQSGDLDRSVTSLLAVTIHQSYSIIKLTSPPLSTAAFCLEVSAC